MKRLAFLLPVALLLIAGAGGCSEEPDFPTAPVYGTMVITNNTVGDIEVIRFRVTSPTSDTWGRNMLGETESLGDDTWFRVPPGTYDFYIETGQGYWVFYGVSIQAGTIASRTIG